jgi:SSS family solute:Na+ symporter
MLSQLPPLEIAVLAVLMIFLTGCSLWAGLRRKTTEADYFMAGRSLRWWSVAGSIYGTNVSAAQLIGMLGVGYTIGFAQSHYEVLAILPILILAYVFVPVYRRREVFTLSQYLAHRYDDRARLAYAVLNILFILIQLVGFFYIGSRQLMLLFQNSFLEISYLQGILVIAVVTCIFTVLGGMESVVIADNIQTVLMILAAILVAVLTYAQPEIGGFTGLLRLDASAPPAAQKMHLYLPSNHPSLPWTGAFTGLMILHCFYWTTNQYQVQRVLAAASDRDAKVGVLVAGILKLTIPFFSIGAGVAAAYLFKARFGASAVQSDDAFLRLMQLVVPAGYGLIGLILAGLVSAIFSAIYSMMNSVTTLVSVDVYQRYLRPRATEREVVYFGKGAIVLLCGLAVALAYASFDPNSASNFYLDLSARTSYIKPGIVVAFFVGILWGKANPKAALLTMLAAPVFGLLSEWAYNEFLGPIPAVQAVFGEKLNFMHRVFLTTLLCTALQLGLSLVWKEPVNKTADFALPVGRMARGFGLFLLVQAVVIGFVWAEILGLKTAAFVGAILTLALFQGGYRRSGATEPYPTSDVFLAALLSAATVYILYFFA